MKKLVMAAMVVVVGMWMATSVQAGVIAGYGFGINPGTLSPTTLDANALGTAMSSPKPLAVFALTNDPVDMCLDAADNVASPGNDNEAAVVAGNYYFTWTVTANSTLDLDSLTWDMLVSVGGPPMFPQYGETNARWWLYSDVGGFVSPNHIAAGFAPNPNATWASYSVDLTDASFQGLASIELRMYIRGGQYGPVIKWDNINLNGDVIENGGPVIPEPATMLLVGTGLIGVIGIIRRRRMQ